MVIDVVRPRVHTIPECAHSLGDEAISWALEHGMTLDPEQNLVLEGALGVRQDGRWQSLEVGVNMPRQNGKGEILIARELYGIYELGERFIVHSAHEFKTSERHFQRVESVIRASPELLRQVKRAPSGRIIGFRYSHGDEAIELQDGRRIEFRTRTRAGMRGFEDVSLLVLDEAMILSDAAQGAMMPTVRASTAERGPQLWYMGSAVDQLIHEHGGVFARVRWRGLAGDDPSLAYFEWSLDFDHPDEVPDEVAADPDYWRQVNFAIERGRVAEEHMAREFRSLSQRMFVVELLGVGDWPSLEIEPSVINLALWNSLADAGSAMRDPICLAFAVNPRRTQGAIGAASLRADGKLHVEVVEHHAGTGWIVDRLAELAAKHKPAAILCDDGSPAASLLPGFTDVGLEVHTINGSEFAKACGMFFDLVETKRLRHLGTTELLSAIKGATQRPLREAWAWARKGGAADITPLEVVTVAAWGTQIIRPAPTHRAFSYA